MSENVGGRFNSANGVFNKYLIVIAQVQYGLGMSQ